MQKIYGIPFLIIASKRRKHSIGFKITFTGLEIRVPLKYDESTIFTHIEKRKNWIQKNWSLLQTKQEKPTLETWLRSENPFVLCFWESFPLKLFPYDKKSICVFDGEVLRVYIKESLGTDYKAMSKVVINRYKKEAKNYLIAKTQELASFHNFLQIRSIFIKSYKGKYGMCKGKDIYLDYKIITLPKDIIDHIILHELTHLIYKHHQKSFRQKLESLDTNWKKHRDFLRGKLNDSFYWHL